MMMMVVISGLQPAIPSKILRDFVGIIQLLCNPDGYTLVVTLRLSFSIILSSNEH